MKTGRRIIFWIVAFAAVFATFLFAYTHQSGKAQVEQQKVPVEVEAVSTGSIEETIELTGWIEANTVVDVKSKVSGRLESLQAVSDDGHSVAVEEGLAVKKGQQLAVIDRDIYLAKVGSANAQVMAAEVELTDAQREKKRIVALYEAGSVTEQNKDKAVTAAELAAARLNSAEAILELAEIDLRESTVRSPIDGIVTAKYVEEGAMLEKLSIGGVGGGSLSEGGGGGRIVTVADMKTVKLVVPAAEKHAGKIAVGMPAEIRVDPFADKTFEANIYSIHPALDEQTHTIPVEIRLQNDELLLKPGMFARVTLITERKANVVVIPRDVILGGKINPHYVYVVEDGIARKRFVKPGIIEGARCEIADGLKAGEMLVINGMNFLADGIGVEVVRLEDIK